jgi:hypothetical protein
MAEESQFGVRTGIHSYRIFDVAIFEIVLLIVGAYGIQKYWGYNFWRVLLTLFLIGILAHRVFNVRTKVDTVLFP